MIHAVRRSAWRFAQGLVALFVVASAHAAAALPIAPAEIDRTVTRAMQAFQVPGIAVGIIKEDKLVFARGYGVRELGKPGRVDPDTLFQIGSNTKAFTTAALATLVDAGKIRWDDKVIDYLPRFRLYDAYVTREFTIRDLLTHRSGLGLGAGDLMFWPTTDFSRAQIMQGLQHLKPVSSFRSKFDYDNLLYMVAGEIIPVVTGESWEDFIEKRIIGPLQMQPCAASYKRLKDLSNVAAPHVVVEGKLTAVPVADISNVGPAGTITCSVNGMSKWLMTQLNQGKTASGEQLFSTERSAEMWSVVTPLPIDSELAALTNTHLAGYGLGWALKDTYGRKQVAHTGGVPGTVTWVTMIPELKLGILVFTNQQSAAAMESVGNQILSAYLGAPKRDWVKLAQEHTQSGADAARAVEDEVAKRAAQAGPATLPLESYVGDYSDPWRGGASVRREGDKLLLKFSHTDILEGAMSPYSGNIFIVRWKDRTLEADAFVRFTQGFDGSVEGMTMQAISPATDFSYDFQDLNFTKTAVAAAH